MSAPLHVPCPHCGALNRVPTERLGELPTCGRCKQPMFEGKPVELDTARFDAVATRGDLPVLVDFWATWCEPCKKELPELEKLQQALAARGVVILGVSIDKERANAQELAAQLKLTLKVLHDPEGKVAELYDPPKMPSSYVIDRDGVVRYINQGFTGAADVARLRQQLEKLSQPAAAGSPPTP